MLLPDSYSHGLVYWLDRERQATTLANEARLAGEYDLFAEYSEEAKGYGRTIERLNVLQAYSE